MEAEARPLRGILKSSPAIATHQTELSTSNIDARATRAGSSALHVHHSSDSQSSMQNPQELREQLEEASTTNGRLGADTSSPDSDVASIMNETESAVDHSSDTATAGPSSSQLRLRLTIAHLISDQLQSPHERVHEQLSYVFGPNWTLVRFHSVYNFTKYCSWDESLAAMVLSGSKVAKVYRLGMLYHLNFLAKLDKFCEKGGVVIFRGVGDDAPITEIFKYFELRWSVLDVVAPAEEQVLGRNCLQMLKRIFGGHFDAIRSLFKMESSEMGRQGDDARPHLFPFNNMFCIHQKKRPRLGQRLSNASMQGLLDQLPRRLSATRATPLTHVHAYEQIYHSGTLDLAGNISLWDQPTLVAAGRRYSGWVCYIGMHANSAREVTQEADLIKRLVEVFSP